MTAFVTCIRASALAMLLAVTSAVADDADRDERLQEARALIGAMHFERQVDAMAGMMSNAFARTFAHTAAAKASRVMEIAMAESMLSMKEYATAPGGLIDLVVEGYASQFSAAELRQIRAFHESPVGQKMIDVMPEMMQKIMQQSMKAGYENSPKICERIKARLVEEGFKEAAGVACPPAK